MKKGILKFLAGTVAVATLTGGMAVPALAAPEKVTEVTKMDETYYKELQGKNENLKGTPSLTIEKYKNGTDPSQGIKGVVFKYAKVGDLYQVVNGNEVSMAFGVNKTFAEKFEIQDAAAYSSSGSEGELYYYKDIGKINTEHLQTLNVQNDEALKTYVSSLEYVTTDKNGNAEIPGAEYGLYVLIEWDTSGATINGTPVSLTNTQSPFLVALPTTVTEGSNTYWEEEVKARIKNSSDEADVEKKIVTAQEDATNGDESVDDTDITSIGDTVHFRLKGTIPNIPKVDNGNQEQFKKYVLVDNLSKGLTPKMANDGVQLEDVVVRTTAANTAYKLSAVDYTTAVTDYNGEETEYEGGKTITVTLTPSGLNKISNWAADETEKEPKEIYFYYTAVVNENAVIGPNETAGAPAGNPNEVKLQYKIGTSAEMETEWDKVTEYTFGINAEKRLAGSAQAVTDQNKNSITFALYSEEKDAETEETSKKYYEMVKGNDGVYRVTSKTAASAADNTKMHPAAGGALNIQGLEEGTYFLEELITVSGYNLLKAPVKIEITANKDENTYVGTDNQYVGTIDQEDNTDGIFKVAINNIKGFELPITGGNGIWFFVLAGVLVVAAGCGYYSLTLRKNHTK